MRASYESKIKEYLNRLPPGVFGMESFDSIDIVNMHQGSYNLNFHVRLDRKNINFRINIDQQSGLANQIEYEYRALEFLDGRHIAPRAYLFDDQRDFFDFGIMVQEFIEGRHLTLEKEDVFSAAALLSRLHLTKPAGHRFMVWKDPLPDTYKLVSGDTEKYETMKSHDGRLLKTAKKVLSILKPKIDGNRGLFQAESLNHTDVSLDNFIQSRKGLRLIDWEKPRVDDVTYDICCFISEPAELWCSERALDSKERDAFIDAYGRKSDKNVSLLKDKVTIREPMVSLHWILWGATKLCDLEDSTTSHELIPAHKEKIQRYKRIADTRLIEKILDRIG